MPGRGPTTFQKRQKEQARKEKREEKLARRHQKKKAGAEGEANNENELDGLGIEQPSEGTDEGGPQEQGSIAND